MMHTLQTSNRTSKTTQNYKIGGKKNKKERARVTQNKKTRKEDYKMALNGWPTRIFSPSGDNHNTPKLGSPFYEYGLLQSKRFIMDGRMATKFSI